MGEETLRLSEHLRPCQLAVWCSGVRGAFHSGSCERDVGRLMFCTGSFSCRGPVEQSRTSHFGVQGRLDGLILWWPREQDGA